MSKRQFLLLSNVVMALLLCFSAFAGLSDDLVAHYPFDGNANEATGSGYNGAVDGATLTTDRFSLQNRAYYFDGVNDKINVNQDQFISNNTLSVSMWVKPSSANANGTHYFAICSDFGVWQNGPSMGLAISLPTTKSASGTVALNEWNHFLGTYDGTNIKVYINGDLVGTTAHSGTISDPDYFLTFGFFNNTYWQGVLDDVRIYDRVINPAELAALSNSIFNIQFNPTSPESLALNEHVDITFDYYTAKSGGVKIFPRPFSDGALSPDYGASGSVTYPQGIGSGSDYFTITAGMVHVDEVRFRMTTADQSEVLLEFFVPVDYYFPVIEPPPVADIVIKSEWTDTPPAIDGVISSGEWSSAAVMPLYDTIGWQRGDMYLYNDNEAFYILLEVTSDTVNGGNYNDDHAGIAFDINLDTIKSPYVDLRYATATGTENLGIQMAVTENSWTGLGPTTSLHMEGFGTNPSTVDPAHKFYEYKLNFDEIGINYDDVLANPGDLFHARINVQAISDNPSLEIRYPSTENGPWHNPMIRVSIDIGTLDVGSTEPVIAGIGLVPRTFIDQSNGLATTGAGHQINVVDAPFGKHLRVIGNIDKLRGSGVNYYAIGYCNMAIESCDTLNEPGFNWSDWDFVKDTRSNYYWSSTEHKYNLDNDGTDFFFITGTSEVRGYPMASGSLSWYFPNLLFDWRTTGTVKVNSGLYKLHLFGFSSKSLAGLLTGLPDDESSMVVRIDNTYPVMTINSISYNGEEISGCGVIQLADNTDSLVVNVSAYDPDGYLNNFTLQALYGDNQRFTCHTEGYSGSGPVWYGAMPNQNLICAGDAGDHWETTCGYTFKLSGWDRAFNGYTKVHYNSYHKTITVLMPDYTTPNDPMGLEEIIYSLQVLTGAE